YSAYGANHTVRGLSSLGTGRTMQVSARVAQNPWATSVVVTSEGEPRTRRDGLNCPIFIEGELLDRNLPLVGAATRTVAQVIDEVPLPSKFGDGRVARCRVLTREIR